MLNDIEHNKVPICCFRANHHTGILPRASTVVFETAPHPGDSVPAPLSVPQPTRTADRAVSFCD